MKMAAKGTEKHFPGSCCMGADSTCLRTQEATPRIVVAACVDVHEIARPGRPHNMSTLISASG